MADEPLDPTTSPLVDPVDTSKPQDAADTASAPTASDVPPLDEVVEAELVETPDAPEPLIAPPAEPVAAQPTGPAPQYVVVEAPRVPRKHGNRGIGSLLAVIGAVVFGALLVGATYLLGLASGDDSFAFVEQNKFYLPIVIFAIAFVLLVLLVNRGAWWAYILGSLIVGIVVYFGTAAAGAGLDQLAVQLGQLKQEDAGTFGAALSNHFVILAAVLSREVALWWGSLIAHRGRRMTAKNRVAREAFDQQLAEFHAKYGRTTAV